MAPRGAASASSAAPAPDGPSGLLLARQRAAQRRALAAVPPPVEGTEAVEGVLLGRTEPRVWTRPLRELTPETSYGYDVVAFARDTLGRPLDPWQEFVVVHAGELLEDGRPRFRKVLVVVSRQQGKTEIGVVLSLYWLFVEQVPLVLGTSTQLSYAEESWNKAVDLAQATPLLAGDIPEKGGVRRKNGDNQLRTVGGSRYRIAASNSQGGRSLTVHRLILDELREHRDYSAWDAAVPATDAVRDAQIWALTNAGSDRSVVLNDLQAAATTYAETGEGDDRLGLFEWSAPPGSSPLDLDALAQAAPNLGRRNDVDALLGDARRAVETGGEALASYLTERMCIRVRSLDPAVDPDAWTRCLDPGELTEHRARVALCVDVAIDQQHATLAAAAVLPDGRVRVEVVASWDGSTCTRDLRRELPGRVAKVKPVVVAWLPAGPAAAVAADLADHRGRIAWPPPGVRVEEIRGAVTDACMSFAAEVVAGTLAHSGQELLEAHVGAAEKLWQGDKWRFTRKGAGHADAAYAAAGAVHAARTMPTGLGTGFILPRSRRRPGGIPQE